ncbi:hypothetical protein QZH41_006432 [Actinostola sp. cb2023]|nr:hypothetical protein QZH41_006432 [Actinostola sp. cb2023]
MTQKRKLCQQGTRQCVRRTNVKNNNTVRLYISKAKINGRSKQSVLLISFDGLGWKFIESNLTYTPNFDFIANTGAKAKNLIGVHPVKTYPVHTTFLTGLYPESHGIVDNKFWDPRYLEKFILEYDCSNFDTKFYNESEPIWMTMEKRGRRTGVYYWPGSTSYDQKPSLYTPPFCHIDCEKYKRPMMMEYLRLYLKVHCFFNWAKSFQRRIDTAIEWLVSDDPPELLLLYFEQPDLKGHSNGPNSKEYLKEIEAIDRDVLGYLLEQLRDHNLIDSINTIVVSDYGMIETQHTRQIRLHDYIKADSYFNNIAAREHIWPKPGRFEEVYNQLKAANNPHLNVYKKEDIPEELHYNDNRRIPPIYLVAEEGWLLRPEWNAVAEGKWTEGSHSWPPTENSAGIFYARGPAFKRGYSSPTTARAIDIYSLLCHILDEDPLPNNGSLSNMEEFLRGNETYNDTFWPNKVNASATSTTPSNSSSDSEISSNSSDYKRVLPFSSNKTRSGPEEQEHDWFEDCPPYEEPEWDTDNHNTNAQVANRAAMGSIPCRPEFESRIRQNEINNPKFNFLNNGDPYNAYFQHKVKEFKEQLGKGGEPSITPFPVLQKPKPLMQQQITLPEAAIPKEPPPDFEFVAEPPRSLPPPVTQEQLGARILAQERYDKIKGDGVPEDNEMNMDVEMEVDEPSSEPPLPPPLRDRLNDMDVDGPKPPKHSAPFVKPPPLPPSGPGAYAQIRRDYDPKAPKPAPPPMVPEKFLISPITGERVPASQMAEHMKINLLDPRWKEQRDRALNDKKTQEEVFAEGMAIGSSLKQLAERRTDIFGAGDEETGIGRKIGEEEERKPEKVTWDGHTGSMAATSRRAHAGITVEQQIEAIHKSKGLIPSEESERIGPKVPGHPSVADIIRGPPMQLPPRGLPLSIPSSMGASSLPPPPPGISIMMNAPPPPPPSMPPTGPPKFMGIPPPPPPGSHPMPPPQFMNMPPAPPPMQIRPPPSNKREHEPDDMMPKRVRLEGSEAHLIPEDEFLKTHPNLVTFIVQVPDLPEKGEWKLDGKPISLTLPLTDQFWCPVG